MSRTLVTGGAGFIGSHIVRRLLEEGNDVRVIDNLSTGRLRNVEAVLDEVDFVKADIREPEAVEVAARGCDAVIHLAAVPSVPRSIADPATTHAANATGTLNVLMAARNAGVARVVFASSSSIYGAAADLPKHESLTPLPISPYAVSKLAAESYCRSFFQVYGLETVALRYFNVFGPRQDPQSEYSAVIPKFIWAYRNGEPPVIYGDGEQSRDFTYVENVVEANLAALRVAAIGGQVFNIACGEQISLNQLADELRNKLGVSLSALHGPDRNGDVRHSVADIGRAREMLGYEPRVSLTEGLGRTIAAFDDDHAREADAHRHAIRSVHVQAAGTSETTRASRPVARRPQRGRRYLITGGAGFIGSHLAEALSARDDTQRLVLLDDLSAGSVDNIRHVLSREHVQFVKGSVNEAELVDELMAETDFCFHLASAVGVQKIVDEPLETLKRSVRGSNVVMHSAAAHDVRVLFSSTSEVYGKHTGSALTEESDLILGSPAKGRWTYAIAKSFGEALVHGYHKQRGVEATVVRLFNAVGPRQTATYGMVLPRFVRQALSGHDLTVYGTGAQTRCFTHVKDTISALLALSENDEAIGRGFNVGTATPVAIVELARRVIERTGSSSGIVLVPYEQAYGEGFEELGRRQPDTTALRNLTGWQPRHTVDDAIDDLIAYHGAESDGLTESPAVDVA